MEGIEIEKEKGVLNGIEIAKRLLIEDPSKRLIIKPIFNRQQIQPASIDVRLGTQFKFIRTSKLVFLNPLNPRKQIQREVEEYTEEHQLSNPLEKFVIHPFQFVLASTLEYISLPKDIGGKVEGRSSWGRVGLMVHSTAGYIDPGYKGNITFELLNVGYVPIPLYAGIRLGQLSFYRIDGSELHYTKKKKYQKSIGTVGSRFFDDPEFEILRKKYYKKEYTKLCTNLLEIRKLKSEGKSKEDIIKKVDLEEEIVSEIFDSL